MPCYHRTMRFIVLTVSALFLFGCANTGQKISEFQQNMFQGTELPEAIASSLDEMPNDAAAVATAIGSHITATGPRKQKVDFGPDAETGILQNCRFPKYFTLTGAQLFSNEVIPNSLSEKSTSGRLDFEGPMGRRYSVSYNAEYLSGKDAIVIQEAEVTPIYSNFPEPRMYVVPAEVLLTPGNRYPQNYGKLLELVSRYAIPSTRSKSISKKEKDYVIFIFFRDQIAPSARLEVKISEEPSSISGYKESTRYMKADGWDVALLPARFTLFGKENSPPLYVKAVFTPGKEVSFARRTPRRVGLFTLSGNMP